MGGFRILLLGRCWGNSGLPNGGYGVTQRGGLWCNRCAFTGVVGFWLSTGIASNGRDVETASEAGVAVVAGFVRTAGWPPEKRWRWSLARRSAKGLGYPVRPTQEPRPKVSPGIPDAEDKKVARAFLLGPIPQNTMFFDELKSI